MVKIYIPQRINEIVRSVHDSHKAKEWSCMCKVIDWKDGYAIVNMMFPEQKNTQAHTEITEKGLVDFAQYVIDTDIESMPKWNLWMHSHNSMALFWSGDDERQKKEYGMGGNNKHFFHIVTGYGASKSAQEKEFGGVRYKGCVKFYDIDVEIDMEFELGLGLPDDIYEHKKDIERRMAAEFASLDEKINEILSGRKVHLTKEFEKKINSVQDYVNHIVKKETYVKFKSIEELVEGALTQEKVAIKREISDEILSKYQEEIKNNITPYEDSSIELEYEIVEADYAECIAQLAKNEINTYAYGGSLLWGGGSRDTGWSYENGYYDKKKEKEKEKKGGFYEDTPDDRRMDNEGNWVAPTNRDVQDRERTYFKKGFYFEGRLGYWRPDKFYFSEL